MGLTLELADSPAEAAFRHHLREWLDEALPALDWPEPADLVERVPFWRKWQLLLQGAGYVGLSWPKEHGGAGLGVVEQAIFAEECDLAGAPQRLNIIGDDFAGPTIAALGTENQRPVSFPGF